jgi:SAM-dependent methyltransferase
VLEQLTRSGFVYDLVQYAAGAGLLHDRLTPVMAGASGHTVLDVGAGTGLYASCLPPGAHYIWTDHDLHKLARFRERRPAGPAVLADATQLPFASKSIGWTMCVNVTHHLPDDALGVLLDELARVTTDRIVFNDPLAHPSLTSRALWRLDQGSYPRTDGQLLAIVERHLDVVDTQRFGRFHQYLLIAARPPVTIVGHP